MHGFPYYLRQAGYHTSNNAKTDYNVKNPDAFIKDAWSESSAKAGWKNRKSGQPFFSVFNFENSHQAYTMTHPYDSYAKTILSRLSPANVIEDSLAELPPFYRNSPEMRRQFTRVYNSIQVMDHRIGELLKQLEADHLSDSTIIFCFADHGQGIPRGKTNGIALGYQVPFIVWFPPMYRHLCPWPGEGVVTNELVSFEDMAPTMLALAGVPAPAHMKGRTIAGPTHAPAPDHLVLSGDRADNGIDMVRSVTDGRYFYSRNFMPYLPELRYIRYMEISEIKQQMRKDYAAGKLNKLQKSLFEDRPAEYLFDLLSDPWETNNLANHPASRPVLEKMRRILEKEMTEQRDVMLLPEFELDSISKSTNAYEYRLNDTLFPVKTIYASAALAGIRGKATCAEQAKLLKSKNKVVRYWALQGLRAQSARHLQPYLPLIRSSMRDAYAPAAVMAAAIAYHFFDDQDAARILKSYCKSDNSMLALMAISQLLYTHHKERFTDTVREVHARKPSPVYDVKAACQDFLGSLGLVPNTTEFEK